MCNNNKKLPPSLVFIVVRKNEMKLGVDFACSPCQGIWVTISFYSVQKNAYTSHLRNPPFSILFYDQRIDGASVACVGEQAGRAKWYLYYAYQKKIHQNSKILLFSFLSIILVASCLLVGLGSSDTLGVVPLLHAYQKNIQNTMLYSKTLSPHQ